jgi:hypothetical protein
MISSKLISASLDAIKSKNGQAALDLIQQWLTSAAGGEDAAPDSTTSSDDDAPPSSASTTGLSIAGYVSREKREAERVKKTHAKHQNGVTALRQRSGIVPPMFAQKLAASPPTGDPAAAGKIASVAEILGQDADDGVGLVAALKGLLKAAGVADDGSGV